MSRSRNKKLALFQRGAAAAQRYTGFSEFYFCPICGTRFSQSALSAGELTLEHVPPASVGGKGVALTCSPCNNNSGDSIDAAISDRANLIRFAEVILHKSSGHGGYACLQIGGERVNVKVFVHPDGTVNLEVLKHSSNPRIIEYVGTYLESLVRDSAGDGEEFHITSRALYQSRLAMIGDLKSAFLVAFAAFGYRYAFDPRIALVRQQLLNPRERVIDGWTIALNQYENTRYLLLITESLPGVVVKVDKMGILLPWLNSPGNFYSELAAVYRPKERIKLSGKSVAWPTWFEMALDFWQSSHSVSQSQT